MLHEIFNLGKHCLDSNIVAAVVALICIIMMLMSFKRTCDQKRLLYWLEVSSIIGVMVTVFGYVLNLVRGSALLSTADYANYFMWGVGSTAVYWPIWFVGYLYSKIRRGIPNSDENHRNVMKTRANQQVDPIVTTPVDEVEAQSTQGHP